MLKIFLLLIVLVSGVYFVYTLYKGSPKDLSVICCVIVALPLFVFFTPGASFEIKAGPVKGKVTNPNRVEKLIGGQQQKVEAKNTDTKNSETILVTASPNDPTQNSEIFFGIGKEYVKSIKKLDDGSFQYIIDLPPQGTFSGVTPTTTAIEMQQVESE